MNNLSNKVYQYYCSRFETLQFDKQLHFASRLYLWSHDDFAATALENLKAQVTQDGQPEQALRNVYADASQSVQHGSKNAAGLRAPYFERYPSVRPLAMVLFRLNFLQSIYSYDVRSTFFELFNRSDVEDLLNSLIADRQATAILSTHAINILYLYNRVVLGDDEAFDPAQFLTFGADDYDFTDPVGLQLYIYLYTHCMIGESRFYARAIPLRYLRVYRQMIERLEQVISDHFADINLDNKFEFLVCCALVGHVSPLQTRIAAEAERSIAPDGTYVIDRHNNNPQTANATLDRSEHRNVLFVMANRPWLQAPSFDRK